MKEKQTLVELKTIVNLQIPEYDKSLTNLPDQDKIKFRRDRINRLQISGYTNKEIAKKIGCSLSTVEKDLQIIRERSKKWYEFESIYDYCKSIQDFVIFYDNAINDLQILYQETIEIKEKLEILNKITEFRNSKLQLFSHTQSVQRYVNDNSKSGGVNCE
jgi:IS30 family transposase